MGDLFFVLKTLIFTVLVVVLLQVKVGGLTLEEHSMDWIHESSMVSELRGVAAGAVRAGEKGISHVKGIFSEHVSLDGSSEDKSWIKIRRSDAYYKQKSKEEREKRRASREEEEAANEDVDRD